MHQNENLWSKGLTRGHLEPEPSPSCSVGSVEIAGLNLRVDDSQCKKIYFSLTTVHCFDNDYVGKQLVAWKEYCVEYWLKE